MDFNIFQICPISVLNVLIATTPAFSNNSWNSYPVTFSYNSSQFCLTRWSSSKCQIDGDFGSLQSSPYFQPVSSKNLIIKLKFTIQVKWVFEFCSGCVYLANPNDSFVWNLYKNEEVPDYSKSDFKSKLIILDFFNAPQSVLDISFQNYSKMRNYYNNPYLYAPLFMTCKIIADSLNSSLLTKATATATSMSWEQYPILNPVLQIYESMGMSLEKFYKENRFSDDGLESIQLARLRSLGFNFAYCDVPHVKQEKFWKVFILIKAFSLYAWLALLLSMGLITVILSVSIGNKPFFVFYLVLAALISVGPSFGGGISSGLKNSKLFVLWMLMCIILVTYYSGSITSLLISPPEEAAMTEITQLVANNYSVVFDDPAYLGIVDSTVKSYLNTGEKRLDILGDMRNIRTLLDKMGKQPIILNRTDYIRNIAYGRKIAAVYLYPYVLSAINDANILIASEQRDISKRRHCYLGKRIIDSGEVYFGISPPGSEQLRNAFQAMFETGLYVYWMTEYVYMSFAKRVQDRKRVVNPTQIKYDFVSAVSPLQLDGKMLTVFFLWGICVLACLLAFFFEILQVWKNRVVTRRIVV